MSIPTRSYTFRFRFADGQADEYTLMTSGKPGKNAAPPAPQPPRERPAGR